MYFYLVKRNILLQHNLLGFGVFAFLFFLLIPTLSYSQTDIISGSCIGFSASTNGVGITGRTVFGNVERTYSHSLRLSLQTLRNPNEAKVQNIKYTNPKPYVFDKINQGSVLRIGYGLRKKVSKKALEKPLLSIVFGTGANIGFLKPYYVRFENPDDTKNNILVVQQNEETRKYQENITGPSNWTKGFGEMTTQIGLHTSLSLDIEWIHSYNFRSWETGVQMDYFLDELQILNNRNYRAFVGIFTSYSFGKK